MPPSGQFYSFGFVLTVTDAFSDVNPRVPICGNTGSHFHLQFLKLY